MTPAEFKTLKDYLGLTVSACAEFLGVQERSVLHWSGKRVAPEELQSRLLSLNNIIQKAVDDILEVAFSLRTKGESAIHLYRYRDGDMDRFDPYLKGMGLPDSVHGLMVGRAKNTLELNDFIVTIDFIDMQIYLEWLGESKDTVYKRHSFLSSL